MLDLLSVLVLLPVIAPWILMGVAMIFVILSPLFFYLAHRHSVHASPPSPVKQMRVKKGQVLSPAA